MKISLLLLSPMKISLHFSPMKISLHLLPMKIALHFSRLKIALQILEPMVVALALALALALASFAALGRWCLDRVPFGIEHWLLLVPLLLFPLLLLLTRPEILLWRVVSVLELVEAFLVGVHSLQILLCSSEDLPFEGILDRQQPSGRLPFSVIYRHLM